MSPPKAMITTPAKATTSPMTSGRGNPSPKTTPATTATRMGATLTTNAAVPASRCSSAQFNITV